MSQLVAVFVVTENVDSMVGFYRDVVGLPILRYQPGDSAWFDTGAAKLVVHRPELGGAERDWVPAAQTIVWLQPAKGVPTAAKALAAAGVELLRPQNAENYIYFRDPEGRLLALHQPPET